MFIWQWFFFWRWEERHDPHQAHFMSVMMSDIASVRICTFSNLMPRLKIKEKRNIIHKNIKRKKLRGNNFWVISWSRCTSENSSFVSPVFMEVKRHICEVLVVVEKNLLQICITDEFLTPTLIHQVNDDLKRTTQFALSLWTTLQEQLHFGVKTQHDFWPTTSIIRYLNALTQSLHQWKTNCQNWNVFRYLITHYECLHKLYLWGMTDLFLVEFKLFFKMSSKISHCLLFTCNIKTNH